MARIRTIKPDLFRHEDLFLLEQKTGLPIRFAFAGLFTVADREGRFKWRPNQIKLDVLPYDEVNMNEVLNALWIEDFINKYEIEGNVFGYIPSWNEHQKIRNDEAKSTIPEPKQGFLVNPLEPVPNPSQTRTVEGKGREVEGKGIGKELLVEISTDQPEKKESGENELSFIDDDPEKEKSSGLKEKDSATNDSDCTPNLTSTASGEDDEVTREQGKGFEEIEKYSFGDFWNLYDKKVGKVESIRQWSRLKKSDKEAVMVYIPAYKQAQPDQKFRKDPERFLKKKCWNDEIITSKNLTTVNGINNNYTRRSTNSAISADEKREGRNTFAGIAKSVLHNPTD